MIYMIWYIYTCIHVYILINPACVHPCMYHVHTYLLNKWERKNKCSLPPFPFPSYLYLLDQLGNSLSLSPLHLSFTTHNQEKADPRWCWWLSCQSINQSIQQTNHQSIFFLKEKEIKNVLLFYLVFGPPSSLRAALLCPLQHLRHCSRGISPLFFLSTVYIPKYPKSSLGFHFFNILWFWFR